MTDKNECPCGDNDGLACSLDFCPHVKKPYFETNHFELANQALEILSEWIDTPGPDVAVIIGPPVSGKTTLLRRILKCLPRSESNTFVVPLPRMVRAYKTMGMHPKTVVTSSLESVLADPPRVLAIDQVEARPFNPDMMLGEAIKARRDQIIDDSISNMEGIFPIRTHRLNKIIVADGSGGAQSRIIPFVKRENPMIVSLYPHKLIRRDFY